MKRCLLPTRSFSKCALPHDNCPVLPIQQILSQDGYYCHKVPILYHISPVYLFEHLLPEDSLFPCVIYSPFNLHCLLYELAEEYIALTNKLNFVVRRLLNQDYPKEILQVVDHNLAPVM